MQKVVGVILIGLSSFSLANENDVKLTNANKKFVKGDNVELKVSNVELVEVNRDVNLETSNIKRITTQGSNVSVKTSNVYDLIFKGGFPVTIDLKTSNVGNIFVPSGQTDKVRINSKFSRLPRIYEYKDDSEIIPPAVGGWFSFNGWSSFFKRAAWYAGWYKNK